MKLIFNERSHTRGKNGDEYRVSCELINHVTIDGIEEIFISEMFEIEVTKEQWDRFVPDKTVEFEDDVKET